MVPVTAPQQVTGPGTLGPDIAHVMPPPAASHHMLPLVTSAAGGAAAPRALLPQHAALPFTRT